MIHVRVYLSCQLRVSAATGVLVVKLLHTQLPVGLVLQVLTSLGSDHECPQIEGNVDLSVDVSVAAW